MVKKLHQDIKTTPTRLKYTQNSKKSPSPQNDRNSITIIKCPKKLQKVTQQAHHMTSNGQKVPPTDRIPLQSAQKYTSPNSELQRPNG